VITRGILPAGSTFTFDFSSLLRYTSLNTRSLNSMMNSLSPETSVAVSSISSTSRSIVYFSIEASADWMTLRAN